MGKKKQIEIIARGLCVDDGKVLLCHTKGADNTYLPGGHVEFEESAKTALEREVQEELGVASTAESFLGTVENTFIQNKKRHCEINLVFELAIPALSSSEAPVSCEDYIEFRWVPVNDLADARLEPATLIDLIQSWLENSTAAESWGSNY